MRLNNREIEAIRSTVEAHFGRGSAICLFGSALDDHAFGRDGDLYIEPTVPPADNLFLARQACGHELELRLKRPVDVVVRRRSPTAFMRQAVAEGQRL
ncbi:nucleotidyltransferase domain-containing protein [Halochromatium sp.]